MRFFSEFITHRDSNGLFNLDFENFLVCHSMGFDCHPAVSDEFTMLCMGGEL